MANEDTVANALAWAQREDLSTGLTPLECDHAVAVAYTPGHSWDNSYSNEPTAYQHWLDIPSNRKHLNDTQAPAGALMFWQSGQDGHVALSMGDGTVATTDMPGGGDYSIVPFSAFAKNWGMTDYLGWTDPVFPNHDGKGWNGPTLVPLTLFPSTSPIGVGSSSTPVLAPAGSPTAPSTAGRIGKYILGALLITLGIVLLLRRPASQAAAIAIAPELAAPMIARKATGGNDLGRAMNIRKSNNATTARASAAKEAQGNEFRQSRPRVDPNYHSNTESVTVKPAPKPLSPQAKGWVTRRGRKNAKAGYVSDAT